MEKRDAHMAYRVGIEEGVHRGIESIERKDRVLIAYIIAVFVVITVFMASIAYFNVQRRKSPSLPVNKIEKSMERYYSGGFRSEK